MRRIIGTKKFYMTVLALAIPIMIQNGITNLLSLADNIMIGQVGTEQMSGVAIVNQLMFVFNVSIFGVISGAGIFGAQFWGEKNQDGVRYTFRFKIMASLLMTVLAIAVLWGFRTELISFYLKGSGDVGSIEETLTYGKQYLFIMLLGLLPFAISQTYASTLREGGKTLPPMIAALIAVVLNCTLNYVLIFGKFGLPVFGVRGAAIATVIARYVECTILTIWIHRNHEKHTFIERAYRSIYMPRDLVGHIFVKGTPLIVNEFLWSAGMATIMQCYSVRGLSVVAGMNISNTINNVFNIVFIALGNSVAIIVGQLLGAEKFEEAKDSAFKLMFFSFMSCVLVGAVMVVVAPFFPELYNTSTQIKELAKKFIVVAAVCMPLQALTHCTYFTLRSGGKTIITFIFDSFFVWTVAIPLAYCLTRFTGLSIVTVYFLCQATEAIKCVIGFILVKKGVWIQKIVQ
ncbi:MAG: MATE family efflux transporter [bacterium]|nr:MATE family efflux transporter [bacterium]